MKIYKSTMGAIMYKMKEKQKIFVTGINLGRSYETSTLNLSIDEKDAIWYEIDIWEFYVAKIPALKEYSFQRSVKVNSIKYD